MHLGALVTGRLVGGYIFPASEKTRSDGADVAGMARYLRASTAREENFASLACHQCNGSGLTEFSAVYTLMLQVAVL